MNWTIDSPILIYTVAICVSLLGVIGHWYKRWAKKQTKNGFFCYLRNRPDATARTMIFGVVCAVSAVASMGFDPFTHEGFAYLISIGYMADSMFNEDTPA
jgi:hypothetical protein